MLYVNSMQYDQDNTQSVIFHPLSAKHCSFYRYTPADANEDESSNSCIMVFTVYGISTVQGLYVRLRAVLSHAL